MPIEKEIALHSVCGSAKLDELDFTCWWTDGIHGLGIYIHVRKNDEEEGVTYHRVQPKNITGYDCHRIGIIDGKLIWIYDRRSKPKRKPSKKA